LRNDEAIARTLEVGAESAVMLGIQLPRNTSMSLFLSEARVTGTDKVDTCGS